jgi:hypothetical protein
MPIKDETIDDVRDRAAYAEGRALQLADQVRELTGTHPIIDRDIDFYIASLETEERIQQECPGGRDLSFAFDCANAARDVVQALRRYRLSLHLAGRLDVSE